MKVSKHVVGFIVVSSYPVTDITSKTTASSYFTLQSMVFYGYVIAPPQGSKSGGSGAPGATEISVGQLTASQAGSVGTPPQCQTMAK